jgi:hypothetical protein
MTIEQPYAAWHEHSDASTRAAHAVAVSDGRPSSVTLCGQTVNGQIGELFIRTRQQVRCSHCALVVGTTPV